jgi:hypothetical protein
MLPKTDCKRWLLEQTLKEPIDAELVRKLFNIIGRLEIVDQEHADDLDKLIFVIGGAYAGCSWV